MDITKIGGYEWKPSDLTKGKKHNPANSLNPGNSSMFSQSQSSSSASLLSLTQQRKKHKQSRFTSPSFSEQYGVGLSGKLVITPEEQQKANFEKSARLRRDIKQLKHDDSMKHYIGLKNLSRQRQFLLDPPPEQSQAQGKG